MRRDMSPDEFAREMMNSFSPRSRAYYQEAINALQLAHRSDRGRAGPQRQRHHFVGSRRGGICSASGFSRCVAGNCTGSITSKAGARSSPTMPSFSLSRPRLAAIPTAPISCRTTSGSALLLCRGANRLVPPA